MDDDVERVEEMRMREDLFTAIRYQRSSPRVLVGNFSSRAFNRLTSCSAVGSEEVFIFGDGSLLVIVVKFEKLDA